jgi:hypothetical protein
MIGSRKLACAGVMGLAALGAFAASAIAQSSAAPHIVARPHIVMVNGTTTLIGAGFPPDKSILLRECSTKLWIVPQEPCDTKNEQTITTSSAGTFTTPFTVHRAPGSCPWVQCRRRHATSASRNRPGSTRSDSLGPRKSLSPSLEHSCSGRSLISGDRI